MNPNLHVILVGQPGIGKTKVMKEIQELLERMKIETEVMPSTKKFLGLNKYVFFDHVINCYVKKPLTKEQSPT